MNPDKSRGHIFVLVGPGGTGKNTLMNVVKAKHPNMKQLATATTRAPRDGEVEGREHLFVSPEEFRRMIVEDELLEHQEVTTNKFYGIPRYVVENSLNDGIILITDVEFKGARILHDKYPDDTTMIFVTVPGETLDEKLSLLRQRMITRLDREPSTDDLVRIDERLERAKVSELPFRDDSNYVDYEIINDTVDEAAEELNRIIVKTISVEQQS